MKGLDITLKIVAATASLIALTIATALAKLKPDEVAERHRNVGHRYADLSNVIQKITVLDNKPPPGEFLDVILKEFKAIQTDEPDIAGTVSTADLPNLILMKNARAKRLGMNFIEEDPDEVVEPEDRDIFIRDNEEAGEKTPGGELYESNSDIEISEVPPIVPKHQLRKIHLSAPSAIYQGESEFARTVGRQTGSFAMGLSGPLQTRSRAPSPTREAIARALERQSLDRGDSTKLTIDVRDRSSSPAKINLDKVEGKPPTRDESPPTSDVGGPQRVIVSKNGAESRDLYLKVREVVPERVISRPESRPPVSSDGSSSSKSVEYKEYEEGEIGIGISPLNGEDRIGKLSASSSPPPESAIPPDESPPSMRYIPVKRSPSPVRRKMTSGKHHSSSPKSQEKFGSATHRRTRERQPSAGTAPSSPQERTMSSPKSARERRPSLPLKSPSDSPSKKMSGDSPSKKRSKSPSRTKSEIDIDEEVIRQMEQLGTAEDPDCGAFLGDSSD